MVADVSERILDNEESAYEFVNGIKDATQRKSVIRTIIDAIKNLINRIKSKFGRTSEKVEQMEKVKKTFENMLAEKS